MKKYILSLCQRNALIALVLGLVLGYFASTITGNTNSPYILAITFYIFTIKYLQDV